MRKKALAAGLATFVAVTSTASAAHAARPRETPTNYLIASWTTERGLPTGRIQALAQDHEGYLWIGADGGLVRFDGFQFDAWDAISPRPLPTQHFVSALHAAKDGALWVGFGAPLGGIPGGNGAVTRIRGNDLRTFSPSDGLPQLPVTAINEDATGTIFVASAGGLFSSVGDRWERWTVDRGIPDGPVYAVYLAPDGFLFATTSRGIVRRQAGHGRFEPLDYFLNNTSTRGRIQKANTLCEDPGKHLYVSDAKLGVRVIGETETNGEIGRGVGVACDRLGNVWVGTVGEGLWRAHRNTTTGKLQIDKLSAMDGLAGEDVSTVLEDRDGNIWAGSIDGLSRITPSKVTRLTSVAGVAALQSTPDGDVWLGASGGLFRLSPAIDAIRQVLVATRVDVLLADSRGTLWAATDRGVVRIPRGASAPIDIPMLGSSGPLRQIDTLATDNADGLWLYDLDRGLFHWHDDVLDGATVPPTLRAMKITSITADRNGNIWFTSDTDSVARLAADGHLQVFSANDGLSAGAYQIVYEDTQGVIWLAGARGLTRFADGRFETVYRDDAVKAVVDDAQGRIWFATTSALVCADRDQFDHGNDDPTRWLPHQRYDVSDGLAGVPRLLGSRSAIRARDGRLWFVTGGGVTIVDPGRTGAGSSPQTTATRIQRVVVDGHDASAAPSVIVPPGTRTVQIDYSALNLNSAEKARFRYRLEGFDPRWADAGSRRTAYYTNLPPGTYRFQVSVESQQDAAASDAVIALTVQPRFYQTAWFPIVAVSLLAVSLWLAWTFRLQLMRHEFATLMAERARLSRDIHDTLLQGLVGIALHLGHVSTDPSAPDARARLIRMRERVEQYIRDARQTIVDLRAPDQTSGNLPLALQKIGDDAVYGHPVTFELGVTGKPISCSASAQQQFVRVMQEAVSNCVQHADAHSIHAELMFEATQVQLHIVDDGRGFETNDLRMPDHFGLVTMTERAEAMGGHLSLLSSPGHGCHVTVTIPTTSLR